MTQSLDPFISRQDLSDLLGRDVTEDEGALAAIDAACDICRSLAGQTFNQVLGDTIQLDGTGTDALILPEFPAAKAGTVAIGGTASSGAIAGGAVVTDYVLSDGILIRTAGAAAAANPENYSWEYPRGLAGGAVSLTWPSGRRNVAVTYDHGYASADLPRDVRMVALQIAARLVVQGVAESEKLGRDVEVKYGMQASDLTAGERAILAKYRRTR